MCNFGFLCFLEQIPFFMLVHFCGQFVLSRRRQEIYVSSPVLLYLVFRFSTSFFLENDLQKGFSSNGHSGLSIFSNT